MRGERGSSCLVHWVFLVCGCTALVDFASDLPALLFWFLAWAPISVSGFILLILHWCFSLCVLSHFFFLKNYKERKVARFLSGWRCFLLSLMAWVHPLGPICCKSRTDSFLLVVVCLHVNITAHVYTDTRTHSSPIKTVIKFKNHANKMEFSI